MRTSLLGEGIVGRDIALGLTPTQQTSSVETKSDYHAIGWRVEYLMRLTIQDKFRLANTALDVVTPLSGIHRP